MSSIHGVNVGGNLFDVTDSSNVAPIELTGSATRTYVKGRLLILSNGLLYKTTRTINSGETLIVNNNIKRTNMDELIAELDTDSNLIAPTENETTSSDDYSIGKQIARSGLLYDVIDDITAGDTFVVGNNIKLAGSVTEQLSQKLDTKVIDLADMAEYDNDLAMLPDGVFFVRSTVFVSDTIENRPFENFSGALVISKRIPANMAKIMTVEPFVRTIPAYTGYGFPENDDWNWDSHVKTSNPNLLDNPWFTVNQRGQSSYQGNLIYAVDRWKLDSGVTLQTANDGVTVEPPSQYKSFWQYFEPERIEKANTKMLTISAFITSPGATTMRIALYKAKNGTVVDRLLYKDFSVTANTKTLLTFSGELLTTASEYDSYALLIYPQFNSEETRLAVKIHSVKLELGTVSTLAMDTAPNYATELLKCQRYFYRIPFNSYNYGGVGITISGSAIPITFYTPVNMRVKPSVSTDGNLTLRNGSSIIPIKSNILYGVDDSNRFDISFATESDALNIGTAYQLYAVSQATYIDLSADL